MGKILREIWDYYVPAFVLLLVAPLHDGSTWAVLVAGGAICLHLGRIEEQGDRRNGGNIMITTLER